MKINRPKQVRTLRIDNMPMLQPFIFASVPGLASQESICIIVSKRYDSEAGVKVKSLEILKMTEDENFLTVTDNMQSLVHPVEIQTLSYSYAK